MDPDINVWITRQPQRMAKVCLRGKSWFLNFGVIPDLIEITQVEALRLCFMFSENIQIKLEPGTAIFTIEPRIVKDSES